MRVNEMRREAETKRRGVKKKIYLKKRGRGVECVSVWVCVCERMWVRARAELTRLLASLTAAGRRRGERGRRRGDGDNGPTLPHSWDHGGKGGFELALAIFRCLGKLWTGRASETKA